MLGCGVRRSWKRWIKLGGGFKHWFVFIITWRRFSCWLIFLIGLKKTPRQHPHAICYWPLWVVLVVSIEHQLQVGISNMKFPQTCRPLEMFNDWPPPHFEKPTMIGFGDSSPWFHYDQLSHFCLWHAADTAPWPAAESAACLSALEWDARNIIYAYAQTCDRIRASLDTCAHAPCYGTHGGVGQVNNLSLFLHMLDASLDLRTCLIQWLDVVGAVAHGLSRNLH